MRQRMLTIFTDTGIIIALIGVMGSFVKSMLDNKSLVQRQQCEIERSIEERKMILGSLLVVLRKLNNNDLNGDIDKVIKNVEEFLLDASHADISKK
jgi:hypothetical protein